MTEDSFLPSDLPAVQRKKVIWSPVDSDRASRSWVLVMASLSAVFLRFAVVAISFVLPWLVATTVEEYGRRYLRLADRLLKSESFPRSNRICTQQLKLDVTWCFL